MGEEPEDRWLHRMDRLRRVVPLPLLVLSSVAAFVAPQASTWPPALVPVGVPLVVAAVVLWTAGTVYPVPGAPGWWRHAVFAAHTALAAVLVAVTPVFGVFAYTGFLFAYTLAPRLRMAGFVATALVVSASMSGGYPLDPLGDPAQAGGYALVALVLVTLVRTLSSITMRAVEQNDERGRVIAELAEANRRLAASTAENAGLQARLLEQAREAGVVAERQRLAGEIHDTLAQDLAGIVTQLEAAARPGPERDRHVETACTLARSALTEARRSVRALGPAALERDGLPDALRALAASTGRLAGLAVTVEAPDAPALPSEVESSLFRVAQEALANAARHARADRVRVTLTRIGDAVLLDVVDDGAGFDPTAVPAGSGGFGLGGMRDRMAAVGGTLTVESAPGTGTGVNAAVRVP